MEAGYKWYHHMSGKGSKRRPMSTGLEQFEENWNRAFGKPQEPEMLREVSYDGMWKHSCTATMQTILIGKGEVCSWCGEWEELPKKWDGDRL